MLSYQYRKSHCGDKTILRQSYLHNGISYTGDMASLYWIKARDAHVTSQTHLEITHGDSRERRRVHPVIPAKDIRHELIAVEGIGGAQHRIEQIQLANHIE